MLASHFGDLSRWLDPETDPRLIATALERIRPHDPDNDDVTTPWDED